MKVSKDFCIQEFVTPEIYKQFKERSIWFIDERLIDIVQYIRTNTGNSVTVNNWHTGGQYKESGLRNFNTKTGAKFSQHKYGRAADIKVSNMLPVDVMHFIRNNWPQLHKLGLTTIENPNFTRTWTHIDLRNTGSGELLIVNP